MHPKNRIKKSRPYGGLMEVHGRVDNVTLNSVGVANAKLLKNLLVEYDFQYYKMEMTTDAQMLIFSEGKSNIMPTDLVVPFQPSQVNSLQGITPETEEAWRCYLATCKSLSNSIGEELQQVLENDLAELRQTDRSLGSQDLSRLLTMARMMSVSYGETTLSLEPLANGVGTRKT